MNVAEIKKCDIANGPGVRVSLFVSGCTHHCPGCFNKVAWDFDYGTPFTEAVQQEILTALAPDYVRGLTLLGGEPLEPINQQALLPFLEKIRECLPNKDIWCYSGYTFEQIYADMSAGIPETGKLLSLIDVLVDGRFIESKKDITLRFRGSSNQRIIDLPRSLVRGEVILWQED